ncbi:CpaD family pilus assembly protein [Pleomorphomonas oryzae]|uniref:CpaD family pilus assembly protein n=1 Tax=Pleomorphomonas oryzae TaxID=261934 RepID=UPI00040E90EC|nr:CpaD family pilus assembly protein [Pleomorphomonas oryzae]
MQAMNPLISSERAPRRFLRPTIVALALTLAACNQQGQVLTDGLPSDGYRSAYPIAVTEAPQTLDIPVGTGTGGLSPDLRAVVADFGADAARNATGPVVVMTPSGSINQAAADYLARQIRTVLKQSGVAATYLRSQTYAVADPRVPAPIRLGFARIKAVSPPCGRWTSDALPDNQKGTDGAEFGCSTQANLAAMVENPNDLLIPRAETPVRGWQRWEMLQKAAKGSSPSATYPTSTF